MQRVRWAVVRVALVLTFLAWILPSNVPSLTRSILLSSPTSDQLQPVLPINTSIGHVIKPVSEARQQPLEHAFSVMNESKPMVFSLPAISAAAPPELHTTRLLAPRLDAQPPSPLPSRPRRSYWRYVPNPCYCNTTIHAVADHVPGLSNPHCGHGTVQTEFVDADCAALKPPTQTYVFHARHAPMKQHPMQPLHPADAWPMGYRIADAALTYIETNPEKCFGHWAQDAIVVDYGLQGLKAPRLPWLRPTWTFVSAYLPDPEPTPPVMRPPPLDNPLPPNLILWNRVTKFRVLSLAVTTNFFTTQLLLRTEEVMAAANLSLEEVLGALVPMARRTLLVLPCGGAMGEEEEAAMLQEALQAAQGNKVGLRSLTYEAEALREFVAGDCRRHLWSVQVVAMVKGVKHKWCDFTFPWRHKFDFILQNGAIGLNVTEGPNKGKVRWPKAWAPSMNSDTLISWGVHPWQKELLLWDIFNYASLSDPGITNWIIGAAGRVLRIDWFNPFMPPQKGEGYPISMCNQMCLRRPVWHPECACCRDCFDWRWDGTAPPKACHSCYVCVHNLLRPRLTLAQFHRATANTTAASAFECSGNRHVGLKNPRFACWPHDAVYEAAVLAEQQRKYEEAHRFRRH